MDRPEDFGITNYKWRGKLLDVDGDVDLSNKELGKLPFNFGKVSGYFDCSDNQLETLEGAPKIVKGKILVDDNLISQIYYYINVNQVIDYLMED